MNRQKEPKSFTIRSDQAEFITATKGYVNWSAVVRMALDAKMKRVKAKEITHELK